MIVINKKKIVSRLKPRLERWMYDNIESAFSVYQRRIRTDKQPVVDEPETWFRASDGKALPVFPHYRYSIKRGWAYFGQLDFLSKLDQLDLLNSTERDFFISSIGSRTLNRPLAEVDAFINKLVSRKNLPLLPERNGNNPVLIPSGSEIELRIEHHRMAHQKLLSFLKERNVIELMDNANILEIGYLSGGYSIIAFERLGFKAKGIDNYYDGLTDSNPLVEHISRIAGSSVTFLRGDITTRTQIDSSSLDLVYSSSVLEHILDLPAAFREMHRILRPGGIMIHGYQPFFCESGGHALAIPDSPWAHVRMNRTEYSLYLQALRPFESHISVDWLNKGLNPCPIGQMQKHIMEAGFNIHFWRGASGSRMKNYPDPVVVIESMNTYPCISLEDLMQGNILVVARKI